jgi:hypothetical protein
LKIVDDVILFFIGYSYWLVRFDIIYFTESLYNYNKQPLPIFQYPQTLLLGWVLKENWNRAIKIGMTSRIFRPLIFFCRCVLAFVANRKSGRVTSQISFFFSFLLTSYLFSSAPPQSIPLFFAFYKALKFRHSVRILRKWIQ